MSLENLQFRDGDHLPPDGVIELYRANGWSAAAKPTQLLAALAHSSTVVTAWDGARLIGLGNAISDGHLVVYYPHLLVLPEYHRRGVGAAIVRRLCAAHQDFHQHVLVADRRSVGFYERCGFRRAGDTVPMWIYAGADHDGVVD